MGSWGPAKSKVLSDKRYFEPGSISGARPYSAGAVSWGPAIVQALTNKKCLLPELLLLGTRPYEEWIRNLNYGGGFLEPAHMGCRGGSGEGAGSRGAAKSKVLLEKRCLEPGSISGTRPYSAGAGSRGPAILKALTNKKYLLPELLVGARPYNYGSGSPQSVNQRTLLSPGRLRCSSCKEVSPAAENSTLAVKVE